jgi:hypothetical protein
MGALFAAVFSACLVYGPEFVFGLAINQGISLAECILHLLRLILVGFAGCAFSPDPCRWKK